MKNAALALAGAVWMLAWLIVPTSWWVQAQILDEKALWATVERALQAEEIDT
jgi:hypothetical protein